MANIEIKSKLLYKNLDFSFLTHYVAYSRTIEYGNHWQEPLNMSQELNAVLGVEYPMSPFFHLENLHPSWERQILHQNLSKINSMSDAGKGYEGK